MKTALPGAFALFGALVGITLLSFAIWNLVEHARCRKNWARSTGSVVAPESGGITVLAVRGDWGQGRDYLSRDVHMVLGHTGIDYGQDQDYLLDESTGRARLRSWWPVAWAAFWLALGAAAWLGAAWLMVRSGDPTRWMLGQPAPEAGSPLFELLRPESFSKANLIWSALGLVTLIPAFALAFPLWNRVQMVSLSSLYMVGLWLLSWHNATHRLAAYGDRVIETSALGHRVVPYAAISRISLHTHIDEQRQDKHQLAPVKFRNYEFRGTASESGEDELLFKVSLDVAGVERLVELLKARGVPVSSSESHSTTWLPGS